MILKSVDLRDFRSHRHTTVDFDEGISVIVGDNGSGKTSILDSINFALFKQRPGVNMDDLIRRGAEGAEVSVTFTANGRTFRATRGRKTGRAYGSALYSIDNGEALIVKGEDEITKEIEEILGLGGELFTSAVYIKQGEIDKLISEQAAKRKEHVGKLLGADELEKAHQGMGELLKEYRIRAEGLKGLPDAIKEAENAISEKKDSIRILKVDLKKTSKASDSVKKELEEIQASLKDLEQLRDLEAEEGALEIRLKKLKEDIGRIEEYESELNKTQCFHDRYAAAEKEIKALGGKRKKLYELQERSGSLERELKNVEDSISTLESAITEQFKAYNEVLGRKFRDFEKLKKRRSMLLERLGVRAEKIDKKIKNTKVKISSASEKNTEIEGAITELKKAGAECPVCKGPLDKKHKDDLLAEYSQKIEKNTTDIKKWESALVDFQKESLDIDDEIQRVEDINVDLLENRIEQKKDVKKISQKIKADIKSNEKELKEFLGLEKSIKKLEDKKAKLEAGNERYIAAKSYLRKYLPEKEDFKAMAKEIEKQLLKLGSDIKKLGGPLDVKKFERTKLDERKLQDKFNDAQSEKARLESRIGFENENIESLKKSRAELKSKEKERKKLSKFLVFLEDIRRLFHKDSLQRDLRARALPLIESYTEEIFDMFDLPYTDLELTDDFNVVLFSPHGEESVDMLSGGEKIASALALRMGIAKALSGSAMELIILDEPTIHLDSQRRQDLVEIIKKLSVIPQTIVVTHDKEFEQAADKLIVVEKVGGISRVSS